MKPKTLFLAALAIAVSAHLAFSAIGAVNGDLSVEEQQVILDMEIIGLVIETAENEQGKYPGSREVLVKLEAVLELLPPPFEDRFQRKDPWGNKYVYWSDERVFAVLSPGFDGRLDFDYLEIPSQEWAELQGDDAIISDHGWIKRPLSQTDRQKRTMADLRSMGTAIEEYSIDNNFYPTASNLEELAMLVRPSYMRVLPRRDGWGHEFIVRSGPDDYVLISVGKDGFLDGNEPAGATNTLDSDIVFANGSFVQWPERRHY